MGSEMCIRDSRTVTALGQTFRLKPDMHAQFRQPKTQTFQHSRSSPRPHTLEPDSQAQTGPDRKTSDQTPQPDQKESNRTPKQGQTQRPGLFRSFRTACRPRPNSLGQTSQFKRHTVRQNIQAQTRHSIPDGPTSVQKHPRQPPRSIPPQTGHPSSDWPGTAGHPTSYQTASDRTSHRRPDMLGQS